EEAVQRLLKDFYIVRISWVFGVNGKNFIKTMLRLSEEREEISVVSDQIGSPTYTKDLAETLVALMESGRFGIYHATNEGICSWAEFAAETMRLAGKSTRIKEISTSEYKTAAKRPLNSRLSKSSLDKAGIPRLPHWKDALGRYLKELSKTA
ncbi:MAG: sugar nucleotide-binding protein, partial [Clostridiales bacterium]|nr:sugar nucleotide-binding protein [Clostridiales bacterium]